VGLSVSRVGGAAQTKAMKQSAGSLRIDLAQFREMEAFTQFSSDLDEITKRQLVYGQGLMRLLRQGQYQPYAQHSMVILLIAALGHTMEDIPLDELPEYREKLLAAIERKYDDICRRIDRHGNMNDRDKALILNAAKEFSANWLSGKREKEKADGER
jgi:F-type H+-transporting ATPase subunit alpha